MEREGRGGEESNGAESGSGAASVGRPSGSLLPVKSHPSSLSPPDPAENSKGIREEKEEEEEGGEEVDLTDWLIYGRRRSLGVGDSEGTKGCWVHKLYRRTLLYISVG